MPEGFVGTVRVEFGIAGQPPLSLEDGRYVVEFDQTGLVQTSTEYKTGYRRSDQFYYKTKSGLSELSPLRGAPDQMIWGEVDGTLTRLGVEVHTHQFFVGTATDVKRATRDDPPGPLLR